MEWKRISNRPLQSIGLIVLGLGLFLPRPAFSNFAADDQRANTKTFAPFFMKRFHAWHGTIALQQVPYATEIEQKFIDQFIGSATSFGSHEKRGFVRAFDYAVRFDNTVPVNGPYRFFDTEDRENVRATILAVLKKEAPSFDTKQLTGRRLGLGFKPSAGELELIVWEKDLANSTLLPNDSKIPKKLLAEVPEGKLILTLKASKIVSGEVLQVGVSTGEQHCPPATSFSQTDRVLKHDGSVTYLWHLNRYEEQAIDPSGREMADKYRNALNLIPGAIEWTSYKSYSFSYP
jgi:hypothetical protein